MTKFLVEAEVTQVFTVEVDVRSTAGALQVANAVESAVQERIALGHGDVTEFKLKTIRRSM